MTDGCDIMLDVAATSPLSRRTTLTPSSVVSTESELLTTQVCLVCKHSHSF